MTRTLDEIKRDLGQFDPASLEKLRHQINFLLEYGGAASNDNPDEITFYQTCSKILRQKKVIAPPYSSFKKSSSYRDFRNNFAWVESWRDEMWPPLDKRQKLVFYQIVTKLVIRELENQGLEVSIGMIGRQLGRVPGLFARAFPGYLESNLHEFIVGPSRNRQAASEAS